MSCPESFNVIKNIYDDFLKKTNKCSIDSDEYKFNKNTLENLHKVLESFNNQYPECMGKTPLYTLHFNNKA